MRHFYQGNRQCRQLRLSVSAIEEDEIGPGLDRLAAFIAAQGGETTSGGGGPPLDPDGGMPS